jgi:hypothetical protein
MRFHLWFLLTLVACTQRRDDAARPGSSTAAPTAAPSALPARALSTPQDVYPYVWPQANSIGSYVEDAAECAQRDTCPETDEGKARRKAERAFECRREDVDVALRRDAVVSDSSLNMEVFALPESDHRFFIADGWPLSGAGKSVTILLRRETASVFQVVGCNHWGVVVCVTGNRSIRTPDSTYENTADRVCQWGQPLRDQPLLRSTANRGL